MRNWILACSILASGLLAAAPRIAVHGHRGAAAFRPENTIPSFKAAIEGGADYIELDIYPTRDNVLVVSHDAIISPAVCKGPDVGALIHTMTLDQVRRNDCGSLHRSVFPNQTPMPGTRIPTIDEVFDLAKTSGIRFNVEIKSSPESKEQTLPPAEIAQLVAAAVRSRKLEQRVLVQSFDFRVVKAMKATAPELDLAALYGAGNRSFVDIAKETGARTVTPAFKLVTPEKVREAHASGIKIVPWTVDTSEEWDRLIAAGVDGIITNDPAGCVAHLKSKGLH